MPRVPEEIKRRVRFDEKASRRRSELGEGWQMQRRKQVRFLNTGGDARWERNRNPGPFQYATARETLAAVMDHPDPRTKRILELRAGKMTLEEIGADVGLSRERVRQIIREVGAGFPR